MRYQKTTVYFEGLPFFSLYFQLALVSNKAINRNTKTGEKELHHTRETIIQRAVKNAT